jgi:hypothetical protein
MSIFTVLVCLAITVIESAFQGSHIIFDIDIDIFHKVRIATMLYRDWRGLKEAGKSRGVSVQFIVRIIVFGIYIFMSML